MGMKEDELIQFLDAFMSGDGCSIKPQIDENGDITYFTARDNAVSNAMKENMAALEGMFGERQEREGSLFNSEGEECPTCASIPNLSDEDWDD